MELADLKNDVDYIFTVKDEDAFIKYLKKKW